MALTVLIADDDGVSRKLLRRLLEQDGYAVCAAANGVEALELFAEEAIDIVLLDIVMPGLDGISVLEHLKATPGASHVPVIMISAVDETESVVRCIEDRGRRLPPEAVQPRDPPREDQRRADQETRSTTSSGHESTTSSAGSSPSTSSTTCWSGRTTTSASAASAPSGP